MASPACRYLVRRILAAPSSQDQSLTQQGIKEKIELNAAEAAKPPPTTSTDRYIRRGPDLLRLAKDRLTVSARGSAGRVHLKMELQRQRRCETITSNRFIVVEG